MLTKLTLFVFVLGATTGLVIPGAIAWARDLRLKMSWWKWLLAGAWYALVIFSVLLGFTVIGEGETAAGVRMLGFSAVVLIVLGVGLARLLLVGRRRAPAEEAPSEGPVSGLGQGAGAQ